jgi:N-acetylmuramoyl-L-alanine amidase
LRIVAIDPGHGGDETGASGPGGTLEKQITLDVAQRLRAAIESRLGLRVVLTRTGDETIPLDQRAAIANFNQADLFISLHANASIRTTATGAEVFYLSLDEYGQEAQDLAEFEGQRMAVAGGGSREIDLILWDMAQVRYLEQSARLAAIVEEELRGRLDMSPRAIQQAPFRVLVGANMPAVLVEMGFISNPAQEQQLTTPVFQGAVVEALLASIVRFRDHLETAPQELASGAPAGAETGRAAGVP